MVTGRLDNFSCSQIQGKIKELGGAVSGGISRKTDYLVAGDAPGSKLADAQDLEVQVIGEEEFLEMVEDGSAGS